MRTTVVIADDLLRQARILAAESGRTLSAVIEDGLSRLLESPEPPAATDELPAHGSGGVAPGVDLADNRAVRDLLDRA